jgi:hypothetical protein
MRIRGGQDAGAGLREQPARAGGIILAALLLGLATTACTTDGQPTLAAATPRGPTIAFESIDGPPESVFHRLVQTLSDEAEARQMAVVSREAPAQYRVRGYLAAQTQGKRSTVAWVWDIYDSGQRRTVRISGEEVASAAGRGTWAVADDFVIRRIAHVGIARLVAFLASPDARQDVPVPDDPNPAMTVAASKDTFISEASASLQPPAAAPAPGTRVTVSSIAESTTPAIPLPKRRAVDAGRASQDSLAYLAQDR